MNTVAETFELLVNSYTDAEELMNSAATWRIQDSLVVRFRLFQLHNQEYDDDTINEQLENILDTLGRSLVTPRTFNEDDMEVALNYVQEQEEIEGAVHALLVDDEMEALADACVQDRDWAPSWPQIQTGKGDEPQPGPSHQTDREESRKLKITMRQKAERTYAKNAAVYRTYQVKVDEQYHGQQLQDVSEGLHDLFHFTRIYQEVLNQAIDILAANDLGRVVMHHEGLQDPIVIPSQAWDTLDVNKVMEMLEKVLISNQSLTVNESFDISISTIDLPKGGARRRITRIKGDKNSLNLKKSVVTIGNEDHLCMARAIGVAWTKLKRCTPEEWKEVTKYRQGKSNLQLVLEHQKVPLNFYNDLVKKDRKHQGLMAATSSQREEIPQNRTASLNDIEAFEELLGVRVMVVSAGLGNKFITSPSTDERPRIYLYLVDDDHFHAITSITGFFNDSYFCETCLYHYINREKHQCDTSCIVCKRGACPKTDQPLTCTDCNMDCRSQDCYDKHKEVPVHKKGKMKRQPSGPTCYKIVRTDRRNKEEHECGEWYCGTCETYVMDTHLCYLRANECQEEFIPKFIFFDFECSQDEITTCIDGYKPLKILNCMECQPSQVCKSCSKCQNCKTSWCGKATHRPNFVVAHTVCPKCIDEDMTPESTCKGCRTRCKDCENIDLYDSEDEGPCPGTCGFREVIFQEEGTAEQFGRWLFSEQHEYFKIVAHNLKGLVVTFYWNT